MIQPDWTKFALQRPNYFPGQYLLDKDFELAHQYLHDRQRYFNSRLYMAGIVEGLEVEAMAGLPEVLITAGTAIDGEGNLIVVSDDIRRPIPAPGWLCLRFHQEAKLLQQPEIPESFTRFVETPVLTLEVDETQDSTTVILAQLTLENGQVRVNTSVRRYSGARLPSGEHEAIALQSNGEGLGLKGDLHLTGQLQLNNSALSAVSKQIDTNSNRMTVAPSEQAVKAYVERWLVSRLTELNLLNKSSPASTAPTDSSADPSADSGSAQRDYLFDSWSISEKNGGNKPAKLQISSWQAEVEQQRLIIERNSGNVGIGTLTPTHTLEVNGIIRAKHVESTNMMKHWMYPDDPLIYQDIFEAVGEGAIKKHKEPAGFNNTTHTSNNKWGDRPAICFAEKVTDDSGALIAIPEGYNTIWLRVPGDAWSNFRAQFFDKDKEDLGYWTAGKRNANCYCPDGSLSDSYHDLHQWLPIPAGRAGTVLLTDRLGNPANRGIWLTGLGFSKNPWAHATQSAVGYHWNVNGGNAIPWGQDKWEQGHDAYANIPRGNNAELMVPYVWSGRDKLLYIVMNDGSWNESMHSGITVNGESIENFLATYDNPFARHWNSRIYARYLAARIPASLIPKPTGNVPPLLKVKIDMSKQDQGLSFRELGTHDFDVPDSI